MLTVRSRYDHYQKYYLKNLYEQYGEIPENHMKAMRLRMEFFSKYILDRHSTDYQTSLEKDWAYIARREYRWNVVVRSLADAFALGNLACVLRMLMVKKFVLWPMIPILPVAFIYRQQDLFMFYNKKFFDMCNVGEQYELGAARNSVLRECNKLLDTEDF